MLHSVYSLIFHSCQRLLLNNPGFINNIDPNILKTGLVSFCITQKQFTLICGLCGIELIHNVLHTHKWFQYSVFMLLTEKSQYCFDGLLIVIWYSGKQNTRQQLSH